MITNEDSTRDKKINDYIEKIKVYLKKLNYINEKLSKI